MKLKRFVFLSLFIMSQLYALNSYAETTQNKAEAAVATILFEHSQGDEQFASYRIDEKGYAYVSFAANTPDKLYLEIITAMQKHPDIRDLIQDKGGPTCSLW